MNNKCIQITIFIVFFFSNAEITSSQSEEVKKTDKLITNLNDRNWEIRRNAALDLGKIVSKRSIRALINALKDKHIKVVDAVTSALITIGNPAIVELIDNLKIKDYKVQERAANALYKFKSDGINSELLKRTVTLIELEYKLSW